MEKTDLLRRYATLYSSSSATFTSLRYFLIGYTPKNTSWMYRVATTAKTFSDIHQCFHAPNPTKRHFIITCCYDMAPSNGGQWCLGCSGTACRSPLFCPLTFPPTLYEEHACRRGYTVRMAVISVTGDYTCSTLIF